MTLRGLAYYTDESYCYPHGKLRTQTGPTATHHRLLVYLGTVQPQRTTWLVLPSAGLYGSEVPAAL